MRPDSQLRFALKTLAWLPACVALWYVTGAAQSVLLADPARALVNAFFPHLVQRVSPSQSALVFETTIRILEQGRLLEVLPEVDPRVYTCGVPLFLALMLASRARLRMAAIGAVALVVVQALGIAADFLAQVGVRMGPDVAARAAITHGEAQVIAFAYQFGSLILPTLAPVALWIACNPAILRRSASTAHGALALERNVP